MFAPPKRAVRLPSQASGEIKKAGGRSTAHNGPISATNHQWRMKERPTDGSLLYTRLTIIEGGYIYDTIR
ncbi:hypothetical protein DTX80_16355 [Bacilli bacterium]|nr:hypothetical protein WH51_09235 [Bacilli bacterium VT-13-104]PZD83641.1 hypothetical protein DEJ60_16670 [Bacilli bacterium]PZD85386.1 hypothetical protein DEJ66_16920 [Bacilli bacterium]PZD86287.1 hypothetical protein DEJ64_08120 [Bacilli bacterium]RCO04547.1 hypothetical protein DTX80_16355 [Bacilli bacterium]